MALSRVLVGSPVCQKPEILKEFLTSLKNLNHGGFLLDYEFVDDNQDMRSSRLLYQFQREGSKVFVSPVSTPGDYVCSEDTHGWNDSLMLRVGEWKNQIMKHALDENYDALFLVDSDLILNPSLLEHLKKIGKEVVSEIFWTSWHPGQPKEPNVWLFDEYDFVSRSPGEVVSPEDEEKRKNDFLEQLKKPGVYEVGGLGACTLISREALIKGVNFSYISNLTIHGEDRFFSIRAAVLGIGLYVDTTYPAYHIYRPSDLKGVLEFVKKNRVEAFGACEGREKNPKIVLSMTVRNEEGRYLDRVLGGIRGYVDEAVIIDDDSSDQTAQICKSLLQDIPHRLIRNEEPMFANEAELRKKQWEETVKSEPDWILCLDADEAPEAGFWEHLREMAKDSRYDLYGFRLYDMWNESEYREDPYWNAHKNSHVFLLRYHPDFTYTWRDTPQHCGRFPDNLDGFSRLDSQFRVKHFGWARQEDRKEKYDRYRRLDPEAIYGIRRQYDSILDSYPRLLPWKEEEENKK